MDPRDAVLAVLREEGAPLHWTRIQDLALRRGYVDPFETTDVRAGVLRALRDLAHDGLLAKEAKGVYALSPQSES
jgi:hypothetical protein